MRDGACASNGPASASTSPLQPQLGQRPAEVGGSLLDERRNGGQIDAQGRHPVKLWVDRDEIAELPPVAQGLLDLDTQPLARHLGRGLWHGHRRHHGGAGQQQAPERRDIFAPRQAAGRAAGAADMEPGGTGQLCLRWHGSPSLNEGAIVPQRGGPGCRRASECQVRLNPAGAS
jgi:hypothetical protein